MGAVHYFSNNDHADWWMRKNCTMCVHDPDSCEPMSDMFFGNETASVTIDDGGHPVCHEREPVTHAHVLAEWGQVPTTPSTPPPPVLPGQIDIFGNEVA
jgi:hypothetical protein